MIRAVALIACALVTAAVVLPALFELPAVGHYRGPYGDAVVPVSLDQRETTNVVATVAYDVRGFDTLGEELVLFATVIGVSLLLRPRAEAHREAHGIDRAATAARDAPMKRPGVRRASANVLVLGLIFGAYMTLHSTQSPGGGFQGGAVMASALALLYLGGGYELWSGTIREPAFDIAEAGGVLGFAAVVGVPLALGGVLVENWIPLGSLGKFASGGTMFVINIAIAIAVAAGFTLIFGALLYELHENVEHLDQDRDGDAS